MNRKIKLALCGALLMALLAVPGMAATFTYGDLYTEWPGYETAKNGIDAYGNPQILGASVTTYDSGFLKEISIRFLAEQGIGLWYEGDFNSLFINSSWGGAEAYDTWDYYVRGYFPGEAFGSSAEAGFNTFATAGYDLTSAAYHYTGPSTLPPDPILYRDDHPNGIEIDSGGSALAVTGSLPDKNQIVLGNMNTIEIKYFFNDNAIAMGSNFVVGYTPYGAGDVFLTPVPEPTTFILLGAGLALGLCVVRRRNRAAAV